MENVLQTNTKRNEPVVEIVDTANGSRFKIAIFKHPAADGTGYNLSGKTTYSYLDRKEEVWKETKSLSGTDFLRASNLMERAYQAEQELRATLRDQQKAIPPS